MRRTITFGIDSGELRRRRSSSWCRLGSRFTCRGHAGRAARARRAQRAERAGGAGRLPRGGRRRSREAAPALASFSGAGRRFEAHGRTASGARVFDDYAHHPTEVRATLEAARDARAAAARGLLPAAPVLAHAAAGARLRPRAGAGRRGGGARRLPGARAGGGLPGRQRLARGRGGRRRRSGRPAGLLAARRSTRPSGVLRAELREGDVLLTLGAGRRGPTSRERLGERRRERARRESSATTRWRASPPCAPAARPTCSPAPATPRTAWRSCWPGPSEAGSR